MSSESRSDYVNFCNLYDCGNSGSHFYNGGLRKGGNVNNPIPRRRASNPH